MAKIDLSTTINALVAGNASKEQQMDAAKAIQTIVREYNDLVSKHTALQDASMRMMKLIEDAHEQGKQRVVELEDRASELRARIAWEEARKAFKPED